MYELYLTRTICDVLEEMRRMDKTKNYAGLLGAIEEAQSMANRMENAIEKARGVKKIDEEYREKKAEYKKLKEETDKLKQIKDKLTKLKEKK